MAEKKKRKIQWNVSKIILLIGCIIILIPCIAVAAILWKAHLEADSPINGNRLDNMTAVEITKQDMKDLQSALSELDNVEKVEVILKTATLRIYLDCDDKITAEDMEVLEEAAYRVLNDKLPAETYFTRTAANANYDLEMHFYNNREFGGTEQHLYDILTKTSAMPFYRIDRPSDAKNPELAEELLHPVEESKNTEPTDGGENEGNMEASKEGGE